MPRVSADSDGSSGGRKSAVSGRASSEDIQRRQASEPGSGACSAVRPPVSPPAHRSARARLSLVVFSRMSRRTVENRNDSTSRRTGRTSVVATELLPPNRSEEHTSELQSQSNLVCRLLLEKKNQHLNLALT